MEGKGERELFFFKKIFFHTKIDPLQNNFSARRLHLPFPWRQRVRCWDGHTVAHTPNEMHRSSAEGMRGDPGSAAWRLVQRVQGGKGKRHGNGLWAVLVLLLCHSYLSTGSGLGHSGTSRVVQVLFYFGKPFPGTWGKGGICSGFLRSSSQCHSTSNK